MRSLFISFGVALAGVVMATAALAQVPPPPAGPCQPQRLVAHLRDGKPVEALSESERCLAYYRSRLGEGGDWASLNILLTAYYQYANAQLLAMLGLFELAESARFSADSFVSSHPEFSSDLYRKGTEDIAMATKGFIREKRGHLDAARSIYLASGSSYAKGRLALLALNEKDNNGARRWAREGDIAGDATSLVVLGALAELAGDKDGVLGFYFAARNRMQNPGNQFLPIYFAESWRVSKMLASWGSKPQGGTGGSP